MPTDQPRKNKTNNKVMASEGVTPHLNSKSRRRRERETQLTKLGAHAPTPRNDLSPNLLIENVPVDQIRPAVRRVRRAEAAQTRRVRSSIEKFGIVHPVLVDGSLRIVHGHAVYDAARELGLPRIPVIRISHLSSTECRLLSIALNRIAETGHWDEEVLRVELDELIALNEDVFVSGFEPAEIDALLLVDEEGTDAEDAESCEPQAIAVSRSGDIWKLGRHLLLQGDARDPADYARLMLPGEKARLVLTDMPYNVPNVGHVTSQEHHREFAMAAGEMSREEYEAFILEWMKSSAAHILEGGFLATFIDWRSVELVLACGRALGFELLNIIAWVKSNAGQGSLWRSQHELLPVFKIGGAPHVNNVELGRFGRWRSNVWTYAGASSLGSDARDGLAVHPTVKPRSLLEDALLDVSNRDEVVLEPFAGSGSTLIAAEATGRICRAIEIDDHYCDVVIRRWEAMTGESATLSETDETFRAVSSRRGEED